MRLGIDFGTTRTVVALAEAGRYSVVGFEGERGPTPWIPSMGARLDGEWRFGAEAQTALARGAPGVRSLKRALAGRGDAKGEEPLALATTFLREVARATREAADVGPDEPLRAMIAVPANASSRQRFLTLEAARGAGLTVLGMMNEPSAAAIEYARWQALSERSPKRYVVVYDLGGGTFDTAAVSLRGRRFELLASEGIAELGGDDFDEVLLAAWQRARGAPIPEALRGAALETCRRAKEALGPRSRRVLIDPPEEVHLEPAVLDAAAYYEATAPLLARTLERLDAIFAHLPPDVDPRDARQLGAVYLVGGAAAFPGVLRALRERYGRKVALAPEPHAATAVGLAVAADPAAEVTVREATTRFFGVWREADEGRDTVFDPLLDKDRSPPRDGSLVVERAYHPVHTVGHLRFVECSRLDAEGRPAGDLAPYGELRFPYDPALAEAEDLAGSPVTRRPELRGQQIVERYVYGADGRIEVEIENRTSRYRRTVTLGG